MNWQPIETAPKNDADILVCYSYTQNGEQKWAYGIGLWFKSRKQWMFYGDDDELPELWCPIKPPTEQAR